MNKLKLIIGLGNPGRGYATNRHNIGFMCLNHFARAQGIRFDKKQGLARVGAGEVADGQVILARPQTYMNLSGESVSRLVKKHGIIGDDLVVVHDDLDLPPGKIRIRHGGSSGGHKGIASIISSLEAGDFIHLKVGIGRPGTDPAEVSEVDIVDYVLGDFDPNEKPAIAAAIPRASDALYCLVTEGLDAAMRKYN